MSSVPDPSELSEREISAIITELQKLWQEQKRVKWETLSEHGLAAPALVFGHASQVDALGHAVVALWERDMQLQAVPLVRGMVEFAMTAAWLSVAPKSANDVVWESVRGRRTTLSTIKAHGSIDVTEEIAEEEARLLNKPEKIDGAASIFEQRCARLEGGPAIYAFYRVFSNDCHPGAGAADRWLQANKEDEGLPFRFRSIPKPVKPEPMLGTSACMALVAQIAADSIRRERRFESELEGFAKRLGVSHTIRLKTPATAPGSAT